MSTEPPSDNRPNGHAEPQDDAGGTETEPGQVEPNDQVSESAPGGSSDDSGRPPNPSGTPDTEQNAHGEADGRGRPDNQDPPSKSLLTAFVIALSSAVLGLGGLVAMNCVLDQYKAESGLWNNLVGSMFYDLSSPLYVVRQLVEVALDVLLALGILAMVALAVIRAGFPLDAYNAVSHKIASMLLRDPQDTDGTGQLEVSKLAARVGVGTAALVTAASLVMTVTVDVGPQLNDAVGKINTSMGTINTSMGKINTSMGTINTSMGTINRSVRRIDSSMGAIDGSMVAIDSSMGAIDSSMGAIDSSMVAIDSSMGAIDSSVEKTTQAVLDISAVRISPESLAKLADLLRNQSVAMRTLNSTVADLGEAIRAETAKYTLAQEDMEKRIRALENLGQWEADYKIERDRRHILKRFQHFFRGRRVPQPQ